MTRMIAVLMMTAAACSARVDAATGPIAQTPLPSLISPADYPSAALRNDEQGTVGFRLDVGADGRVRSCTIVSSSGSSLLDASTCRIMASRARFTPAVNDEGKAVDGSIASRISWFLRPSSAENPRLNAANSLWVACISGEVAKRAITKLAAKDILQASYAACKANEAFAASEFKRAGLPDAAISAAMEGQKRPLETKLPNDVRNVRAALGIIADPD